MIIFIKLLFAHLLGDFILQPTKWVLHKQQYREKSIYLYIHTLIHGLLIMIMIPQVDFIPWAILITVAHGLIDYLKLRFQKPATMRSWFVVDQVLHIAVLAICATAFLDPSFNLSPPSDSFWIVLTSAMFLTKPASIIIRTIISIWTPDTKETSEKSLANAGNYIGIIERLLVLCFVLTQHFEAVGFLLAAKSVFRFGDLMAAKERQLTEYVLIGTLLSFGMAIATGLLAQVALHSAF